MSVTSINDYRSGPAAPPPPDVTVSVETEQAVIGAIMLNNQVLHAIGPTLLPDHFSIEIHQRIFAICSTLIMAGEIASGPTLKTYLGDPEVGGDMTFSQYLLHMMGGAIPLQAPAYARHLIYLHGRRGLLAVSDEIRAQANDPPAGAPLLSLIEDAETRLNTMRQSVAPLVDTRVSAGDAAEALLDEVDRIQAGEQSGMGVTTGIPELDYDSGGMKPGKLWVVAGRVGMGKTVKAISLALAASKSGAGTLLLPFEIGRKEAMARALASLSYVRQKPLTFGAILKASRDDIGDEEKWRLRDAAKRLRDMPLVIDDASGATMAQITSKVRAEKTRMEKAGVKLGVVILDYLNFIKASDRYSGQRHNEIGEISIGLKRMAVDLDLCVVLLAQINRGTEQRDDKRPQISDLKDSGSLEQDADVILMLYRDTYYIRQSADYRKGEPDALARAIDTEKDLELINGKCRTGQTRSYQLFCDIGCSKINAQSKLGF